MPPIELPPIDELEGAAQASPVLSRLTAFARYVGPGRELTQQGYLTLADGRVLVDTLETGDRFDERIGDRVFNTRSTAELPRLDVTFRWARAAGFVKVTHGRVSATQRGDALGAKPVEDWGAAFDGLVKLESTGHSARRRYGLWFREACDWLVTRLPRMLYERSALGAGRLKDVLWAVVEATHYLSPDADVRQHQRRLAEGDVEHLLERFVELGAFTVADGRVSLTSLGLWGARSGRRG